MSATIFITGASAGIGEALALEFARRGYSIAVAARRLEKLTALGERLQAAGAAAVLPLELDVAELPAVPVALAAARERFGRLDVVVANAGVGLYTPVGRGKLEEVRQTFATNVLGAIATIEAALPILRAQSGGQVVGISSIAAWRGMSGLGAYCASKAALHRYLQAVRAEVHGEGIAVTELAPGYIDTEMNRGTGTRPFVIPVERGAAIMARLIERRVGYRMVPALPWTLFAPLLALAPTAWLAPRRRPGGGNQRPS
ncbi:MAG TPA: SDR family NAD(P)-dependent oxidoreductase [Steroidobacteraceae bacterium]|nr:SDR family NAD(P)-dependent oxidoreductase [Steroidobacteraceae bacterium]